MKCVGVLVFATFGITLAPACCGLAAAGAFVRFGSQQNIIIWDEKLGVEHFIRRAGFTSDAKSLGFIAPTPTVPELVEVDPKAFQTIKNASQDFKAAQKREPSLLYLLFGVTNSKSGSGSVRIAGVKEIAGYTATTIQSDDPKALADWLRANDFSTSASIDKWLSFYAKKRWYLTAFKVNVSDGSAATGLVRMSFKTPTPFNPYYVPDDNVAPYQTARVGLELVFLSSSTYKTTEKASLSLIDQFQIRGSSLRKLAADLKLSLPNRMAATRFQDRHFPYHGAPDDLFFEEAEPMPSWPIDPDWYLPWLIMGGLSWGACVVYKRRNG